MDIGGLIVQYKAWLILAGWLLVFLVFVIIAAVIITYIIIKSKQTNIYRIKQSTKRLERFSGKNKKVGKGLIKNFFSGKIGRDISQFQDADYFLDGKKNALILLEDENGFHHPLRLPTFAEVAEMYKIKFNGLDITKMQKDKDGKLRFTDDDGKLYSQITINKLRAVFFMPNPHEDLNWLADKIVEADLQYQNQNWWQHPNVMIIGVAAICCFMFMMTLVLPNLF